MRPRLIAGLCIAAALAGLAWWLFPSEERQVRSRLEELAKAASIPPGEQELERIARLARLGRLLADDVSVKGGDPLETVSGRDSVLGIAAQLRSYAGGLRVELHDVIVALADDRRIAHAQARAVATERAADGRETVEMRDVTLELSKSDRGWQLRQMTVAPEPRPPAR